MRILLFSDFALPDSCAAATRVMNLAKLLQENGHTVELLGISYVPDALPDGTSEGFAYHLLKAKQITGIKSYQRIAALRRDLAAYLQEKSTDSPYDAVILSNVYFDFAGTLMRYATKHKAKLVVNAVEWYDRRSPLFVGLMGKIHLIKNRIALIYIHKKMKNILAISSLLDDYYKARGCNTVTIPTIVDTTTYASVAHTTLPDRQELHIAYAGMPGKKDYILNAVLALPLLSDEERQRIQLHFYGITYNQLCRLGIAPDFVRSYKAHIVCHGRIPYEQVKEKIADADFTILLRPNKRYANAGFPTKVGESMACGTPVIANLTSDLHRYVIDGQTGFVCADETVESCAAAFRKALQMTDTERTTMRECTLKMARSAFDYRAYTEALRRFITELQ